LAAIAWFTANGLFAAEGGPSPVFTNKVRFRIPFRYDAAEMRRLQASEVQLFLSIDQGTRWRMIDKVDPKGEHFDFLAPGDGEYWFAVRTLDAFNRLHPQGNNIEPGLKVIVDTTPPALELTLSEVEPGKIELRWTAADDHLDITKLRLEYRQPDPPGWQQVAIVPEPNGKTTWTLPGGGVVAVRGSIGDAAGNTALAEKELAIHGASQPHGKSGETEYRAPVAALPASSKPGDAFAKSPFDSSDDPFGPAPAGTLKSAAPNKPGAISKSEPDAFLDTDRLGPRIRPQVKNNLVSDSPASRPSNLQSPRNSTAGPATAGEDFAPPPASANPAPKSANAPRTIVVNNRDFQIGYRVDDIGPSGLGKVELFITQDDGRKWYRYGTDPDNKSPFAVSVPADGVYGFELRIRNGAGIGDDPPRPGDKPSIIVTVDKTPPVAELLPPQVGRGNSKNKVLLSWNASDAHLAAAPILLEYAAEAAGPWQHVADWQANTRRYVWSLGEKMPGQVYLRMTVRDEAGNVTQSSIAEPLIIDFVRPTARIVDIEAKAGAEPRN
jgi:hypothetical protein